MSTKLDLPQLPCLPPVQHWDAQHRFLQHKEAHAKQANSGPVFALARIQENIYEEIFREYLAKILGEFARCEYMPRLYLHPREYRKRFLANYLCIGFVPGGNSQINSYLLPDLLVISTKPNAECFVTCAKIPASRMYLC